MGAGFILTTLLAEAESNLIYGLSNKFRKGKRGEKKGECLSN